MVRRFSKTNAIQDLSQGRIRMFAIHQVYIMIIQSISPQSSTVIF